MPDCSDCISTAPSIAPATVPTPPAERRSADHGGGDDQKFGERAFRVRRRVETRDRDRGADGGEQSHQHEDLHDHPACVDAGKLGCFRIAADRINVAAEARSRREEGHCHADADRDQNRNGDAMGDEQAALRKRDMIRLRIAAHAAGRPGIGVENCDGRRGSARRRRRREKFRRPSAAAGNETWCAGRDLAPAPPRPRRSAMTPTTQLHAAPIEPSVPPPISLNVLSSGATVCPLCHPPGRAAPDQQTAERDDEGRNAEIGDHKALERAKDDAEEKPGRKRQHPCCRMFEAEKLRKQHGLDRRPSPCRQSRASNRSTDRCCG